MTQRRPILDEAALLAASDEVWNGLPESDWLQAFASHPRIGDSHVPASATARSASWSGEEQKNVGAGPDDVKAALAEGNRAYEARFHRIFLICATGRSASEILEILRRRLHNDSAAELRESAAQQRQITQIRLKKWLHSCDASPLTF